MIKPSYLTLLSIVLLFMLEILATFSQHSFSLNSNSTPNTNNDNYNMIVKSPMFSSQSTLFKLILTDDVDFFSSQDDDFEYHLTLEYSGFECTSPRLVYDVQTVLIKSDGVLQSHSEVKDVKTSKIRQTTNEQVSLTSMTTTTTTTSILELTFSYYDRFSREGQYTRGLSLMCEGQYTNDNNNINSNDNRNDDDNINTAVLLGKVSVSVRVESNKSKKIGTTGVVDFIASPSLASKFKIDIDYDYNDEEHSDDSTNSSNTDTMEDQEEYSNQKVLGMATSSPITAMMMKSNTDKMYPFTLEFKDLLCPYTKIGNIIIYDYQGSMFVQKPPTQDPIVCQIKDNDEYNIQVTVSVELDHSLKISLVEDSEKEGSDFYCKDKIKIKCENLFWIPSPIIAITNTMTMDNDNNNHTNNNHNHNNNNNNILNIENQSTTKPTAKSALFIAIGQDNGAMTSQFIIGDDYKSIEKDGLDTGKIILIIFGILVVIALIILVIIFVLRWTRSCCFKPKSKQYTTETDELMRFNGSQYYGN